MDDSGGAQVLFSEEDTTNPDMDVTLIDGTSNTVCNPSLTEVRITRTLTGNDLRGESTHEMGHAHGFAHVESDDSWDGEEPTMVGCVRAGPAGELKSIEQDDGGGVVGHEDSDLHANPSWEDNGTWTDDIWGAGGGATLVNKNETGARGTRHAEIQDGGHIFQTMRVIDPGQIKGGGYFKKELSQATGTVTMLLQGYEIEYPAASGICTGQFPPNQYDLRFPDLQDNGTFITRKSLLFTPSTSWSSEKVTSEWSAPQNWEGVDVRIRLENNIAFDGADSDVRVDHLRGLVP